jgi:hypothetical protein
MNRKNPKKNNKKNNNLNKNLLNKNKINNPLKIKMNKIPNLAQINRDKNNYEID